MFDRDFFGANPGRDLDDEIRFHLETEIEELVATGLSPEEARRRALAKFGDVEQARVECSASDTRRLARRRRAKLFDVLRQDLRQSWRSLRNRPAFALTVILVLALGVGANAAIFAIADTLFLRPPAGVRAPDELKRIFVLRQRGDRPRFFQVRFSYPEARILDSSIAQAFPTTMFVRRQAAIAIGDKASRSVIGAWVSPSYFSVIGARLHAGSDFTSDDPSPTAIISWALWQGTYDADPAILGRQIRVDGHAYVVRGIASRGFTGIDVDATDVWLSLASLPAIGTPWPQNWGLVTFRVLARTSPTGSPEQLVARVDAALRYSDEITPLPRARVSSTLKIIPAPLLTALGPEPLSHRETIAAVLTGLTVLLLIMAIANVGNLLLGRAMDRRREIAVRLALGVDRWRLASQLLVELLALSIAAVFAGILAATWAAGLLRSMLLPGGDVDASPLNHRVVFLTVSLGVAAAMLCSLAPLAIALRTDLTQALRTGSRDGGGRRSGVRSALVGLQAALCVVLLVGTGLLGRSLYNVRTLDLGFDAQHLIRIRSEGREMSTRLSELAGQARSLPGVAGVALTASPPLWDQEGVSRLIKSAGDTVRMINDEDPSYVAGDAEYLRTMGTRIVRGRDFRVDDRYGSDPVMIVSEELARRIWGVRDPIGQCLRIDRLEDPCRMIVGVAQDAHRFSVVEPRPLTFYLPLGQRPAESRTEALLPSALVIRTNVDRRSTNEIVTRLRSILGDTTVGSRQLVMTLADAIEPQYAPWEMGARLFASLAVLAIVLASLGLYGVLNYLVTLRARELGIRVALGATRRNVTSLVLREAGRQVAAGAILGLGIAAVCARGINALLFRVAPYDPTVMLVTIAVMTLAAGLAALQPARRAVTTDPMSVMRED